ncbi:hypothetical protein T439DRAFT_329859 [Meredithblackwellia eburnea MCA 4105]
MTLTTPRRSYATQNTSSNPPFLALGLGGGAVLVAGVLAGFTWFVPLSSSLVPFEIDKKHTHIANQPLTPQRPSLSLVDPTGSRWTTRLPPSHRRMARGRSSFEFHSIEGFSQLGLSQILLSPSLSLSIAERV